MFCLCRADTWWGHAFVAASDTFAGAFKDMAAAVGIKLRPDFLMLFYIMISGPCSCWKAHPPICVWVGSHGIHV